MTIIIEVSDSGALYCLLTNPDFHFMATTDDLSFGVAVAKGIATIL